VSPFLKLFGGQKVTLDEAYQSFGGAPQWLSGAGLLLFVFAAIGWGWYFSARVKERAEQAKGAAVAFRSLDNQLRVCLEQPEPMIGSDGKKTLNDLYSSANTLESSFLEVLPSNDDSKAEADRISAQFIKEYCKYWGPNMPVLEQVERGI
jgi:hypothetical protein